MPQAHAFISYVRENSEVVDRLADDLRAYGIKVWVDRDDIMPSQYWKDAISEAIQKGAYFIACFSKELNERPETYMHGELRLAVDRLRNMPRHRVWFIQVLINETDIPSHSISDHETLKDINAIRLFDDWDAGVTKILRAINLDDPDYRHILHLVDLIIHHPAERTYAINAVKELANISAAAEAVPALRAALRDPDPYVRRSAASALARINPIEG
jgi:hypothetical protein